MYHIFSPDFVNPEIISTFVQSRGIRVRDDNPFYYGSFEPQSITATLRSGCVVYKAVMQYCTLSPVDFWHTAVVFDAIGHLRPPFSSHAKHRAGVSAPQWRRMVFLLLDEVEMAASSRQIGPTAP